MLGTWPEGSVIQAFSKGDKCNLVRFWLKALAWMGTVLVVVGSSNADGELFLTWTWPPPPTSNDSVELDEPGLRDSSSRLSLSSNLCAYSLLPRVSGAHGVAEWPDTFCRDLEISVVDTCIEHRASGIGNRTGADHRISTCVSGKRDKPTYRGALVDAMFDESASERWDNGHSHCAIELEAEKSRLPGQNHPSYFDFLKLMKKGKVAYVLPRGRFRRPNPGARLVILAFVMIGVKLPPSYYFCLG